MLNQRYITVDGQRFCDIFLGQEKIPCMVHQNFRAIVVTPKQEAHHESKDDKKDRKKGNANYLNSNDNTPVAFLSRFEKHYLDPQILEEFGVGF